MRRLKLTPLFFLILALLLALPALLLNLGLLPVIDDEAIRAIVAFEMLEKGEFITPTIAGEPYLKKPPLYNWLIASSFQLFGRADEMAIRFPMVISLLMFTLAIFYYFRKEMQNRFAVLAALLFLTSGRVIIYESLHGLIDITYSMVIFIFFMHIYRSFMQGKLLKLYLVGYLLIAISFLLKGLPSIVFLAITIFVLFTSNKKFKLLFHWSHYLGMLIFAVIVGGYYFLYFRMNSIAPEEMLSVVIGESTRRTAVMFGFWKTVLHLLSFPFWVLYHFLPWGFMVILLFRKGIIGKIKKQPFIRYISLVFLSNIIIYWISPEVFPRYVLMLIPLLFGVFIYAYMEQAKTRTIQAKLVEWVLGGVLSAAALAGMLPFFIDLPAEIPSLYFISLGLLISLSLLAFCYWKNATNRLFWATIAILVLRIGFDLIVLPTRHALSEESKSREETKEMVSTTTDHELKLYWNPEVPPGTYYGYRVTSYRFNYYLFLYRDEVVEVTVDMDNDKDRLFVSKLGFIKQEDVDVLKIFKPPGHPSDLVLFRLHQNGEN